MAFVRLYPYAFFIEFFDLHNGDAGALRGRLLRGRLLRPGRLFALVFQHFDRIHGGLPLIAFGQRNGFEPQISCIFRFYFFIYKAIPCTVVLEITMLFLQGDHASGIVRALTIFAYRLLGIAERHRVGLEITEGQKKNKEKDE